MGVAGLLTGLAAFVAIELVPALGTWMTSPWIVALLLGAAAFGAARPEVRGKVRELVILGAVTAMMTGVILAIRGRVWAGNAAIGALAVGFGILVARGGRRIVPTLIASAVTALIGMTLFINFGVAAELAHVPMWVTAGVTGGAVAFVGVLGLLPRHLEIGRDRVADAYQSTKGKLSGEVRELADRAQATWLRVEGSIEASSPVRKAIEDAVVRIFDVARNWAAVESEGARASDSSAEALATRMEAITEKMTRTEDPIAKSQYQQAHAALAEQVRYLKEIGTAHERVIARMHNYLAAMERLRFAVINHRSADASRLSTEVQPILDDLQDLGREIDFSSEAMGEVEASSAQTN